MVKIAINGSKRTGMFSVECECGEAWTGNAEPEGPHDFCPAAPIAEAVVHMKLCHTDGQLDVRFSDQFGWWLHRYWEVKSFDLSPRVRFPV